MNRSSAEGTAVASNDVIPPTARNLLEEASALIRKNPTQALAIAAGAGFLLQAAPVGRVVGGLFRVSFALLRPALMVVGGVKIWEKIQRRQVL